MSSIRIRTLRHRLAGTLVLFAAIPAGASTYWVDRFDDTTVNVCSLLVNGDCSLRGAILKANAHAGPDEIRLSRAGTYLLTLAGAGEDAGLTGDLDITQQLVIVGLGPDRTVIDGGGVDRVFHVATTGPERVTLRGLTITGGAVAPGAGVWVEDGAIRLETCVVRDQTVSSGGAAISAPGSFGSGRTEIVDSWITGNSGTSYVLSTLHGLYLERSTISGNSSQGASTVAFGGHDVEESALVASTISGNSSWFGAIYLLGSAVDVRIDSCTVFGNEHADLILGAGATATLVNTVIAGTCDAGAGLTSGGGNLESPGHSCGLGVADLDDVADPGLSALGWFGGVAPVHQPLAGGPLLDEPLAGPGCGLTDQRRAPRPRDGDGDGIDSCDIGAVELCGVGELFVDGFESGSTAAWSAVVP